MTARVFMPDQRVVVRTADCHTAKVTVLAQMKQRVLVRFRDGAVREVSATRIKAGRR